MINGPNKPTVRKNFSVKKITGSDYFHPEIYQIFNKVIKKFFQKIEEEALFNSSCEVSIILMPKPLDIALLLLAPGNKSEHTINSSESQEQEEIPTVWSTALMHSQNLQLASFLMLKDWILLHTGEKQGCLLIPFCSILSLQ